MRRLLLLAVAVALAGCQGAAPAPPVEPAVVAAPVTVKPPETTSPTQIALMRRNQAVTVGMRADEAFRIFRETREGGFEDERLPPRFARPYAARSWESGSRGFGVITFEDRVVSAMYQEDKASYERALELVQMHQDRMGAPADRVFAGKRLTYWFWEKDKQRLMILAFRSSGPEGVRITMAMGDAVVLDALRIAPEIAEKEVPNVDQRLSDLDSEKNSTSAQKGEPTS